MLMNGCGSDNDPDPAPAPAPAALSIAGIVIDGPIQGATVCLDVNGDGECGPDEPASARTDAAGNYLIGEVTEEAAASAALIALVPADAIDADNPGAAVGTAYRMSAPAGKGALINPITTLIQAGVADGLALADAESAVARQLQVDLQNLYRNYVAEPDAPDSLALAAGARLIVPALQAGTTLEVAKSGPASPPSYTVADFWFQDNSNWYLRYLMNDGIANDRGLVPYTDQRTWFEGGQPVPEERMYGLDTQPVRLTDGGWGQCNRTTEHYTGQGNPHYSSFCGDDTYTSRTTTDISGRSIAEVVAEVQAAPNSILRAVSPSAFGTSVFPAGTTLMRRTSRIVNHPLMYNPGDGSLDGGVAQVVAAFPIPATPAGANTVSMGSLRDSAGNINRRPRAAFGPGGLAQYYVCDLVNGSSVNCQASGTGTYSVTTMHGVPAITFTGQPSEQEVSAVSNRVFLERDGRTYYGWRLKPDNVDNVAPRLNGVAFNAMAAVLGIDSPIP
jgi:hypothetical protein